MGALDILWIRGKRADVSGFGESVASFIGDMVGGIASVETLALAKRVLWDNSNYIEMRWVGAMGTFDSSELTMLVMLAHDRCIRVEIQPATKTELLIKFTPRVRNTLIQYDRHPSLETHIAALRQECPPPPVNPQIAPEFLPEKPFDRRMIPPQPLQVRRSGSPVCKPSARLKAPFYAR
jgi:hypothetical protein